MSKRIVICGGCRTGKTTLAERLAKETGHYLKGTDSLIEHADWSRASEIASYWFDIEGDWIVEGVAAVRALRKWLARNPDGRPCDVCYWSNVAHVDLSLGQHRMNQGCFTVWNQVRDELLVRGVRIEEFPA